MKNKYLNEVKVAEAYLSGQKSDYDESDAIELSVKYLLQQGKSKQTIIKKLNNDKYTSFIMYCIDRYSNAKFEMNCKDFISIYKNEMDCILTADSLHKQILLFIMLVYAKVDNKEWYNEPIRNTGDRHFQSLFKMSKLKLSKEKQMELIHELHRDKFMELPYMRKTDRVGLKLNYIQSDGEIAITIDSLDNLVEQFSTYTEKKVCENCGKILVNKYNSQKLCDSCSRKIRAKKRAKKPKKSISEVENVPSTAL